MADNYEIQTARLIRVMTIVPVVIYLIVALFLTIAALISLGITFSHIVSLLSSVDPDKGIVEVINAILLTVIIIELFETVIVYLRTKQVPVRAILIAGLTAMIRHIIIFNAEDVDMFIFIGPALVLAVLIAGVYLLREEPESLSRRI